MELLPFLVTVFLVTLTTAQNPVPFKCNTPAKCQALVDYSPPNATTLGDLQTLFGVKNFRSILGANNFSNLTTEPTQPVPAKKVIKIPFPCICNNGTGISQNRPIYTVKRDDGLDHIARDIFNNLMTFQQIANVNNIPDPNKIDVGQKLRIPLPCSCDDVDGQQVVHYGHVVVAGSSVEKIASDYGTTENTLLKLNGLDDPSKLQAGQVLDVPIKACTSSISNTSLDYPLLVPNGTYMFTANNCVRCTCDPSKNYTLQCEPSHKEVKVPNWSQCPSMQCIGSGNLTLGNVSSSTCPRTSCSYAGYDNRTISTTLVEDSTCPTDGASRPSGSYATKNGLLRWSWRWILISLSLGVLGLGLVC